MLLLPLVPWAKAWTAALAKRGFASGHLPVGLRTGGEAKTRGWAPPRFLLPREQGGGPGRPSSALLGAALGAEAAGRLPAVGVGADFPARAAAEARPASQPPGVAWSHASSGPCLAGLWRAQRLPPAHLSPALLVPGWREAAREAPPLEGRGRPAEEEPRRGGCGARRARAHLLEQTALRRAWRALPALPAAGAEARLAGEVRPGEGRGPWRRCL